MVVMCLCAISILRPLTSFICSSIFGVRCSVGISEFLTTSVARIARVQFLLSVLSVTTPFLSQTIFRRIRGVLHTPAQASSVIFI